ncbi:SusC/RagA family TonB-linked outer membrane protein [Flavobacterium nackdongense]|uniref:SusC/RagA family TonB-linked outer membrane protein n=1 Tax=Flavobacterium nackdongense TaxID=2547394 RepID=A0A4P6YDT9_9FLAO|nr:SusC/RagA family TonB-linked outer membrane protein [Flavobacterium nackdongense]QBN20498.1 SusC/RagA family TonB-linked outer membrane protein [Flavobacterium nackdongense]
MMIKKLNYKLFLFFVFFVILSTNAQEGNSTVLKGKITDEKNAPLAGALVSAGNDEKTYSNQKGEFEISVKDSKSITVALDKYNSQQIAITDAETGIDVKMKLSEVFFEEKDKINLPFGQLEKGRIVGSVSNLNIEEHFSKDQRIGLNSAVSGKVGGVFGGSNVLGLGNAVYIIDGVPRSADYINLTEIEDVTILKDPVSRVLYGSAADKGVILITTKRGAIGKKNLTVRADYGVQKAVAKPNYLGAADYMTYYNQALLNDKRPVKYTDQQISDTRSGINPIFNPDVDYYSDEFVKDDVSYLDVNIEASGGNKQAQYFLTGGFSNNEGWLNKGTTEETNRYNIRANSNYKLSSKLKMNLDVVGVVNQYKSPNVFDINNLGATDDNNYSISSDFWTKAQTNLPNSFPLLIPIADITNPASYQGAYLVDGKYLLGGTKEFTRNIYGDLTNRGNKTATDRYFQVNSGLDWDLSAITKGLSVKGNVTFDFLNTSVETQNKSYAVYQPFTDPVTGIVSVTKIGADVPSNEKSVSTDEAYFSRRLGFYGTLDYDRTFGEHSIKATALTYLTEEQIPNAFQTLRSLNYGLRANYMFKNKYVVDFSGVYIGSKKLNQGDNFAFAPTGGLGWIISNESFFKKNKTDFLKLRGSVGLLQNDNWDNVFLYESSYSTGNNFNYNNGTVSNRELNINNIAAPIDWQKRLEFNFGFEGSFFNKSLYADASYFYSKGYDIVTVLTNATPDVLGYKYSANNNSFIDSGIEYTVKYTKALSKDVKIAAGLYSVFAVGTVDKVDEPNYGPNAQTRLRTGRNSGALFGLQADGLYGESDFNTDGTLVTGLPSVTFGSVQPGDIKYVDINKDGVIDVNDQKIIGNSRPSVQYSFDFNVSYKKFDFYVLGLGQDGQDRYRNSSYFWISGDAKYSEKVLDAYGPDNKNVNASMPRLSSTNNNNNYRSSTFWLYSSDYFTIPTMQISYNLVGKEKAFFNNIKFFVKGNNLIVINNENDDLRFGVGSSPITKGMSIGLISSF